MSSPLSAFTAVPNPQMLAFMGAQSFIMMYQAGEGWQYGKRKQSAMSNEDFNRQTPISIMQNQSAVLRQALPTIVKSMNDMTPLIGEIIKQYGDFVTEIIKVSPQVAAQTTADLQQILSNLISNIGGSQFNIPGTKGINIAQEVADAIAKALKQGNLLTEAEASSGDFNPPPPTGGSTTLGTVPDITKQESKVHFGGSQFRGSILPSTKGFFQPVSKQVSEINRLKGDLVKLKSALKKSVARHRRISGQPTFGRGVSQWQNQQNIKLKAAQLATLRRQNTSLQNSITLLKVMIGKKELIARRSR